MDLLQHPPVGGPKLTRVKVKSRATPIGLLARFERFGDELRSGIQAGCSKICRM